MSRYFKVVQPNLASFADDNFKYRIGRARLAPKVTGTRELCSYGLLHASPTPEQAARYGRWPYRLLEVEGTPEIVEDDKCGFRRLEVVQELDVALETADVVLMRDDLRALPRAVWLSRRAVARVSQNLVFAFGMIGVLVVATFLDLPLWISVLCHEGSTVLVVANGLRLLWEKTPKY